MKSGDLVLFSGNDLPSLLTKLGNIFGKILNLNKSVKYTHCGVILDDGKIIEALSRGVIVRDFPYKSGFEIWRGNFTENQINNILHEADFHIGKKYSWWLVFALATLKIFHLEWLFKGIGHTGSICSVLVGRIYFSAGYLFNGEGLDLLDPCDIGDTVLRNNKFWRKVQ